MSKLECLRNSDQLVDDRTCISRLAQIGKKNNPKRVYDPKCIEFCVGCTGVKPEEKESIKYKICGTCQKRKTATSKNFDLAKRSADGLTIDCKDCRGLMAAVKNRKKKKKPPLQPEEKDGIKNVMPPPISIDLSKEPELYEKIETWAAKDRRSPENQILWHLENIVLVERQP